MNKWKKKSNRLQAELLLSVLACLFGAFLFSILLRYGADSLISRFPDSWQIRLRLSDKAAARFQDYVSSEGLSSRDLEAVNQWVWKEKYCDIALFDDSTLVYDSLSDLYQPEIKIDESASTADIYRWYQPYLIRFRDRELRLYLRGQYEYQLYNYIYYGEILLSGILFLFMLMLLIRHKLSYITQLQSEVQILEGGNLEYVITEKGQDELTFLAKGLNAMRLSFIQQIHAEQEARLANRELITALSHDLRTPLTTQTGYLEIIKERHWKTEEELNGYLDKCLSNNKKIKEMSDRLFDYFLTYDHNPEAEELVLEKYDAILVFLQLITEQTFLLEEKGFQFELEMPERTFAVFLYMEYLCRVIHNIFSNLQKYASPSEAILIRLSQSQDSCTLAFRNSLLQSPLSGTAESTKIGLKSTERMMRQMRGSCCYYTKDNHFFLELYFPLIPEEADSLLPPQEE